MIKKIHYLILFAVLAFSCSENSTDPYKDLTPLSLDEAVHQVSMTIVDYDSILIESKDSFVLENKSVDTIFISYQIRGNDYYGGTDFIVPEYEGKSGKYQLKFLKKLGVFPTGLIVDLVLSYTNNDGIIGAHDSTFYMYKYPYSSTLIFFDLESNLSHSSSTLQGFEIIENKLYFCPSGGGAGIWRYNFTTGKEDDLYGTGSGDHIAANETYVFHDADHSILVRYNIDADSIDVEYDLLQYNYFIAGLAVSGTNLYAIVQIYNTDTFKLIVFDFSLNQIEEISIPFVCYYLTIYNGIVYFKNYTENELLRFNLATNLYLESLVLPFHFLA